MADYTPEGVPPETGEQGERSERILNELVACYGEGASTDWGYLADLALFIVDMIEREAPAIAARARRAAIEECIEACNGLDECEWGCDYKVSDLLAELLGVEP